MNYRYHSLLLSLISVLLVLFLAELGLRIFYYKNRSHVSHEPDYSYELVTLDGTRISKPGWVKFVLHPYLVYKNRPNQHNKLFNVNSLGFRGVEIDPEKPNDVFRIILLGGSGTFGIGASNDEHTIANQLQTMLKQGHHRSASVEVINAGVVGYLSIQELIFLVTELVHLRPDLVIAYDGFNDFFVGSVITRGCHDPLDNPEQIEYQGYFYEVESLILSCVDEKNGGLLSQLGAITKRLTFNSSIVKLLGDASLAPKDRPARTNRPDINLPPLELKNWDHYEPDSACVELIVSRYRKNLVQMATFLRASNASLLIAVQPERGLKKPLSKEEAAYGLGLLQAHPWYNRARDMLYPKLIRVARQVANEHDVIFCDLSKVFDNRGAIFGDPVHINDEGNELVAGALVESVTKVLDFSTPSKTTAGQP